VRQQAAAPVQRAHPIRPLHWPVEFPEVFTRDHPGFDAIVGNPPFAGKNTLINGNPPSYLDWLQTLHEGAHGNADLVAHFFRRAYGLLRPGGCLGLIATNTIGQGDTRETGLCTVMAAGGAIQRATRRLPWPGEAAVVVSVVHVRSGAAVCPVLDGRLVRRISAYLVEGDLDSSPAPLVANAGKAFQGCIPLGAGFFFSDDEVGKGKANPISEMHRLIAKDRRNEERIFPYLGGEDVNTDPVHAYRRWTIDFNDFPLRRKAMAKTWAAMDAQERGRCRLNGLVPPDYPDPVAADWPDLLEVVERLVKPEREAQGREARKVRWWQFAEKAMGLRAAVAELPAVLAITQTSPHLAVSWLKSGSIYDQKLIVLSAPDAASFGACQSRIHEAWARAFAATTAGDSLSYAPTDCFSTFPFPSNRFSSLPDAATAYHHHRAAVMVDRNEGLTRTYNRFHDAAEAAPDIVRLRALHHDMDVAVLRAYGWDDLADRAAPEFLAENTEQDHRYQGRLFWPTPFRDEVLARLLALNAERAAEERAAGLNATPQCDHDKTEVTGDASL
jgi:hypothetical protein